MANKKEIIKETPLDVHNRLEACINCIYEDYCTNILPFPVNIYDKCDKYKKRAFNEGDLK